MKEITSKKGHRAWKVKKVNQVDEVLQVEPVKTAKNEEILLKLPALGVPAVNVCNTRNSVYGSSPLISL